MAGVVQRFRCAPIEKGNFPADVFEKPEKALAFALRTSATASVKSATTLQLHHTSALSYSCLSVSPPRHHVQHRPLQSADGQRLPRCYRAYPNTASINSLFAGLLCN
jgi:hypothetical protein